MSISALMHTRIHRQPVANYVASSEHRAHTREAAKKKIRRTKKMLLWNFSPSECDRRKNERTSEQVRLAAAGKKEKPIVGLQTILRQFQPQGFELF